jgi:fluoroquinolone transport system permease protein
MTYFIHLRNDIRQIVRDPIMLVLLFVPVILIVVFKLMIVLLLPLLIARIGFDPEPYYAYALSFSMLLIAGMLGIVTGFLMIDERDGNIAELMSVTPLGRSGYLMNRLSFSALVSVAYSFITIYVLDIGQVTFSSAVYLTFLMALYTAIFGLILFNSADDKVKGLTFAKGLNVLVFFAFTDMFKLSWLTAISWCFPSYWITAILKNPGSELVYGIAFLVHALWFGILLVRFWKKG